MRDGEHLRGWMTGRFRAELAAGRVPWVELTGTYRARLRKALAACDGLLAEGWRFAPPQLPRQVSGQASDRVPGRAAGIVGGSCSGSGA